MTGPSLSHLAIFNPTLPAPPTSVDSHDQNRDRDLEDDLAQAAQIVFYTSRDGGHVSRDRMLRQVGLVKGLMSFSDMLVKPTEADPPWWSVRSHRSRLIVHSPEADWYIYANIVLATLPPAAGPSGTSKQRGGEPTPSAQGLSDRMLVDLLQRGYEDFRLLHGPLGTAIGTGSSTLEKFWTRFSFTFEQALSSDPLSTWIDGPAPPSEPEAVQKALDDILSSPDYVGGVISPSRALILPPHADPALMRHVNHLLRASLPHPIEPKDPRRELGKGERRKTSWATISSAATSWVPALPTIPLPGIPRSSTPPVNTTTAAAVRPPSPNKIRPEGRDGKIRWPSLGLGGLGDAVGSVGTVFGLGGSSSAPASPRKPLDSSATSSTPQSEGQESEVAPIAPEPVHASGGGSPEGGGGGEEPIPVRTSVEVDLLDVQTLRAAVESPGDAPSGWETRRVYLHSDDGYTEHTLAWIIRDDHLLFLVTKTADPSLPPASTTNHLFASISSAVPRPSIESPTVKPDSIIVHSEDGVEHSGPSMEIQTSKALAELKDLMDSAGGIKEVYARLPSGKYVAAKEVHAGEVYMGVGKKDASLPEAEHAMRALLRAHPALAG